MRDLLRFELYYFTRQPAFLLAIAMALAIGIMLSGKVVSSGEVQFFSPQNINYFLASYALPSIFMATILAASSLIRDKSSRFEHLIQATQIPSSRLRLSRFLSLYLANIFLSLITICAYLIPTHLVAGNSDIFGSFSLSHLAWPFTFILLPNLLIVCTILFSICQSINKSLWVYLTGVGIYVFYLSITAYLDSPMFTASTEFSGRGISLVSLLDPFAVSAFLEQTQYWTSIEKNTQQLALSGSFALNRIIWLCLCCAMIFSVIFYSSGRQTRTKPQFKNIKLNESIIEQPTDSLIIDTPDSPVYKTYSPWITFKHTVALEFSSIFKSLPFALLMVLTAILVIGQFITAIEMGSLVGAQYPYTSLLAPRIVLALKVVSIITIAFYSAEIVYRTKDYHFAEVLNATPASRWALFTAQLLTLFALIVSLLLVAIVCAIAYQIGSGFYRIEWGIYASLMPIYLLPMIYLAILSMSIQLLLKNKYLGISVSALSMFIFATSLSSQLGLEHVLLKFSSLGTIRYSDFNGFDYHLTNITALLLHWAAVSGLLLFVGLALFNRQLATNRRSAIKQFISQSSFKQRVLLATNVLMVVLTTSFVFWNTNVLNQYETSEDIEQQKVEYETYFSEFRDVNTPLITDIKTNIQFYPQQYALVVSGEFWLENSHAEPITQFIVTMPERDLLTKLSMEEAGNIEHIARHNTFNIELKSPLEAGSKIKLGFNSRIARAGFKNTDHDRTLIENGSYFHSEAMFPYIGFNPAMTIVDKQKRKSLGLPAQNKIHQLVANKIYHEHLLTKDANLVNFETIVSTANDQIAVAPGELIKEWRVKDRRYFQYKVSKPTTNFFGFSSARYEKLSYLEDGILITVYFHPTHDLNIKQVMASARASLKVFSETFSPYPFKQLTIAEIPFRGFARAYPATIFYSENAGFKENLNRKNNIDDLSSVVAHEIAHQWWGHQLKPAKSQGSGLLVESLAEYSSLMVMGEIYGETYLKKELSRASNKYLGRRAELASLESPLLYMGSDYYLRYEKGLLALNAISMRVGVEPFNKLLSQFIKEYAYRHNDYVTNLDFLGLFDKHPDKRFVENWITKVKLYDAEISNVLIEKHTAQLNKLSFSVSMSEFDYTDVHQASPAKANEEIEFAIYEDNSSQNVLIYAGKLTLNSGHGSTSIYLANVPARIEIDPSFMFLDRQRSNNNAVLLPIKNQTME